MGRRRQTTSIRKNANESVTPLPRTQAGAGSELDEYINLGEEQAEEEDLFDDIPDEEESDEDETTPIPKIERDAKLEEEVEQERLADSAMNKMQTLSG